MMILRRVLFLFLLVLNTTTFVFATNYYVSENGNNNAAGISPQQAWKSLDKVNQVNLKPGDTVFFRSNHKFTGSIKVRNSGKYDNPIVFRAYGNGSKPVISGATEIRQLQKVKDNLLSTAVEKSIKSLYQNEKLLPVARYPNSGFLKMNGGTKKYLIDEGLNINNDVITNSVIKLRTINWCYSIRKISDVDGNRLFFDDSIKYTCKQDYGYYLEGKREYLDKPGEWFFDEAALKLYFYTDLHASDVKLEAGYIQDGISVEADVSNITIDGLHLDKFNGNGVIAAGNNKNIQVIHCKITNCLERGIYLSTGSTNCSISGNDLRNIYGQGIFLFEANNCRVQDNGLQRIGMVPGYGVSGVNGATGILITGDEQRKPGNPFRPHSNLITGNRIDSTGYNGIRMDGYNSRCEYNVVKDVMFTLNDGGIIYCWGADSTFTHHNQINHNILIRSHGNVKGTPGGEPMCNGLYIDNRVHHITARNNTISGTHNGIVLNDNTNNIVMRGNVSYGNQNGIIISEWWIPNRTYDNVITNNIFCATDYRKHTLSISSVATPDFQPGVIDSNMYVSLFERFHLSSVSLQKGEIKRTDECSLEGWKLLTGQDKYSKAIINPGDKKLYTELVVNDQAEALKITLKPDNPCTNLEGKPVEEAIVLPPFTSEILIYESNE
jgi:parallel beta-helix repeat protein